MSEDAGGDPGEIAVPASHGTSVPAALPPAESVPEAVNTPEPASISEVTTTPAAPHSEPGSTTVEIETSIEPETPEVSPAVAPTPEPPQPVSNSAPLSPPPTQVTISIKDRAYAALEKIRFRKRAKLEKILQLAAKKKSIKNDDVEKLLKVSDATASRYLAQLVQEGKLKRSGVPGHAVYELI